MNKKTKKQKQVGCPRFGYSHKVKLNLDNSGEWKNLPDGSRIWQLTIACPGALSINLLYDKFWVPDGAKFFIYSGDRKHTIGAFTAVNNKGDNKNVQGFATGLVYSDLITLEYYLPKEAKEVGVISLAYVVQGYRYIHIEGIGVKDYEESGSCQVNINCSEGQNWQNEKNAVAMILVNGNRYCTGSLINTTANDYRPLFLTADHCLGGWGNNDITYDAINNPNLNHWSFYWQYESPDCTNSLPVMYSTVGATIVANNSISDFALLQLTENPHNVAGIRPYYLGWDRSGNSGTGGVGIHHPNGDLKKIATYNQTPIGYNENNFWSFYWSQTSNGYSVAEGGSSGSPLINNNHKVIGQLWGGGSVNCLGPANDIAIYGKFSISWTGDDATDRRRRLKDWLDPINTGVYVLDGTCPILVSFSNQTITNDKTVTSCDNINVQSVTVQNGAKLSFDAGGTTTIFSDFEVALGSQLEIE